MKRINVYFSVLLLVCTSACVSQHATQPDTRIHIKRSSMWVPDLDRAIVFFRDVIGLEIDTIGKLELPPESVLFELFNADPTQEIRRALFSSPIEKRALFVMASPGAPTYTQDQKRSAILLIRSNDLAGVVARAKANGFAVGGTDVGTSPTTGNTSTETMIIGPGGNAVLVYQVRGPDGS